VQPILLLVLEIAGLSVFILELAEIQKTAV